ncbi:MAG TPA: hypothetical protein VKY59_18310 [Spirillospora sp.]|nr:hypothetical protein [Spirillospora sp.]
MAANLARRIDSIIRTAVLLLIAAVALGAVLVMTKSRPEPVLLSPSALASQAISMPQMNSVPGGALVEAPLFWESRQPYLAPVEEAAEVSIPTRGTGIDDMRLVGIVGAGVQSSAAIVIIGGERLRIPFGEDQNGWRLSSMTPTTATFMGFDGNGEPVEYILSLEDRRVAPSLNSRGAGSISVQPNSMPSTWSSPDSSTNPDNAGDADSIEEPGDIQNNQDQNG